MKVKVARDDVYVPKWRDNRKLPETEQIKVYFKYMTAAQEERFTIFKPKYNDDKTDKVDIEIIVDEVAVWNECVTKIEGLVDEKTGKPITLPSVVSEMPHSYQLITEVTAYIRRNLEGEERKN